MTGLFQFPKTLTDEELLCIDEQRKCFLKMESTPGKDAMKTIKNDNKKFRMLCRASG